MSRIVYESKGLLSCKGFPGRTTTLVNDRMSPYSSVLHGSVLRLYMSVSYTEKYCDIRRKNGHLRWSYTESVHGLRFSRYFPVYHRISPYTVTEIHDGDTEPCNTEKYGRIRPSTYFVIVELRNYSLVRY